MTVPSRRALGRAFATLVSMRLRTTDKRELTRTLAWWIFAAVLSVIVFALEGFAWQNWAVGGFALAYAIFALARCAWKLTLLSALAKQDHRSAASVGRPG